MLKKIKNILCVISIVMIFTAQANRPDDRQKGQSHAAPGRTSARTAPAAQNRQPAQTRRVAAPPIQAIRRTPPMVERRITQPFHPQNNAPHVYAAIAPQPTTNNRLFNRQHHNKWQPLYIYNNNQYQFYPYVNVAATIELSADYVSIGYNGQNYFYDRGRFYQQDDQGQIFAVPPPIGIIVSVLPPHARQVMVNDQVFYRYKGIFYVQVAQGFQVIGPVQS